MEGQEGETENQSIGLQCDELGIKRGVVEDILQEREVATWTRLNSALLVNGIVVELHKWFKDHKYNISKVITKVLWALFDVSPEGITENTVWRRVVRCAEKFGVLNKQKSQDSKEKLRCFMQTLFSVEAVIKEEKESEGTSLTGDENENLSDIIKEIKSLCSDCRNNIFKQKLKRAEAECEKVKGMNMVLLASLERLKKSEKTQFLIQAKARRYKHKLEQQSAEIKALNKELSESKALSHFPSDSDCSQLQDQIAMHIERLVKVKSSELEQCQKQLRVVRSELQQMKVQNVGLEKGKKQHTKKVERLERKVKELRLQKNRVQKREATRRRREKPKLQKADEKLRERNKQISELKQELRHLNMKKSKFPLKRFKHGKKYDTRIRAVYQDLLQKYNVSTGNCEGVVRTVLEGLTDVWVGELPKRTAASAMLLEGKTMAQIQVAQSLAEADSMTL